MWKEDVLQGVFIEGSAIALPSNAVLDGSVVFQEAQDYFAQHGEVSGRVSLAATALVFVKGYVEYPVALVLNRPVLADQAL